MKKNENLMLQTLFIFLVFLLGSFVRFFQLSEQIIGDDEWHAITVASDYSFSYILTNFHSQDNCIPLTFIYKIFVETVGLNEITIRSLQFVFGSLMIFVFYKIAIELIGKKVSALFALFLSVSPVLIYYSRYARPYIFVIFFSFISLVYFYKWMRSGRYRFVIVYIVGGVIATYFNQTVFPIIVAPLLFNLFYVPIVKKTENINSENVYGGTKCIFIIGFLLCSGILMWFLPALDSFSALTSKVGQGGISLETIKDSLRMFSGFGSLWISVFCVALALAGLFKLYEINMSFFYYSIFLVSFQLLVVLIISPYGAEAPHVFTRYNLSCLPFFLMFVSLGIISFGDSLLSKIKLGNQYYKIKNSILLVLLLLVFITQGPLVDIYAKTNNFTNHDNFQYGYSSTIFNDDFDVQNVSAFYRHLKNESSNISIIEYPYVLWWSGNFYHYYQQIHRKEVKIGFWLPYYFIPPTLSNKNVKLQQFSSLDSISFPRMSESKYLVIHKDIAWENFYIRGVFGEEELLQDNSRLDNIFEERYGFRSRRLAKLTADHFRKSYGPPFFEDRWLTVYKIGAQ